MVAVAAGDAAQMALAGAAASNGKLEEPDHSSSNWYFSREEIEKRSPSRLDGIDLKKETYFRKSYCTFLQDLGMCLKVPQVTIATAIVFSHRFFLRQSHLKNDRHVIATICMFLAGKVEETPRPLRDVILMSYEIRHKKDPVAIAKIKQKDMYEEQKELVLVGERLVLTTLGFDLNIHHPYKPLVAAIKKLKVAQNALAQVAWNFVNDGLRTSLCLQFKPHHIAAGAIFLAAKFLKVKLPSDGDKVWWQEFEVTPRQLEEVSNQMLELYEQNKTLGSAGLNGSRTSDPGSSVGAVNRVSGSDAVPLANGQHWNHTFSSAPATDRTDKHSQTAKTDDAVTSSRRDEVYEVSTIHTSAYEKQENGHLETEYEPAHENGSMSVLPEISAESTGVIKSVSNRQGKHVVKEDVKEQLITSCPFEDGQIKEELREKKLSTDVRIKSESGTTLRKAKVKTEAEDRKGFILDGGPHDPWNQQGAQGKELLKESQREIVVDAKSGLDSNMAPPKVKVENEDEDPKKLLSTKIEDVNTDRVKALQQRRRKFKGEGLDVKQTSVKVEPTDEEELLERELESGVEAAAEAEKVKQERRDVKSKSGQKIEHEMVVGKKEGTDDGEPGFKRRRFNEEDSTNEKKRTKSTEKGDRADWTDAEGDRSRLAGGLTDRGEDGELPSSSHLHDQTRSPRQLERRPVASGSHDRNGSPSSSKRHRDAHGRRDAHRDGRLAHGSREREYYPRDHHHQHRADGDRDRHHHKDREYQDRDHKKLRAHELHGN